MTTSCTGSEVRAGSEAECEASHIKIRITTTITLFIISTLVPNIVRKNGTDLIEVGYIEQRDLLIYQSVKV